MRCGSCSACACSSRTMKPATCGRAIRWSSVVDAVVADERIGHRHDLARVGRVGEHFLVAGHAGVEDDFAEGLARRAKRAAGEDGAVFEGQFRLHRVTVPSRVGISAQTRCMIRRRRFIGYDDGNESLCWNVEIITMSKPLDRRKFLGSAAALSLSAASYAQRSRRERPRPRRVPRLRRPRAGAHRPREPPRGAGQCGRAGRGVRRVGRPRRRVRRRVRRQGHAPPLLAGALSFRAQVPSRSGRQDARHEGLPRDCSTCKDVDAVCIATPDHWHGRMTVDALAAGKDVYVEKPMTRRAEEAVAVLDAWQRTGRVVTVGVQSMADPVWMRAFDLIRTGGIGHVAHAQTGVVPQRRSRPVALLPARRADDAEDHRLGPLPRPPVRAAPGSQSGRRRAMQPFDRATFAQWRCVSASPAGRSPICCRITSRT